MTDEWKRLHEQLENLVDDCKFTIDTGNISLEDIEEVEIYLSKRGDERKWTVPLGTDWVDIHTPRDDKYADSANEGQFIEPSEIVKIIEQPLRDILKEHLNAKQRGSN